MSEAIKAAGRAAEVIEQLIAEMLEVCADDNCMGLAELEVEGQPFQIQLLVTRNVDDFLDDDLVLAGGES
ncbi:hypothetical protein C9J48_24070 [Photobacterium profundum]|uniref:Uncharacterized protein n=1 Tax=Photobacterium profundum 3TCK TaxID=314280 RepID=Q1Z9D6_9GAMM|nr:hypothetical protein [Photobacterium profundum]EAS44822.1 hypothetical protein P3TCK_20100 [Photobacterium profundum 3TCK]PSV59335.1 hypothetical protein C9J48_24070 [Photobacterium profundum]